MTEDVQIDHLKKQYKLMQETAGGWDADDLSAHTYLWLLADKLFALTSDLHWAAEEDVHGVHMGVALRRAA